MPYYIIAFISLYFIGTILKILVRARDNWRRVKGERLKGHKHVACVSGISVEYDKKKKLISNPTNQGEFKRRVRDFLIFISV